MQIPVEVDQTSRHSLQAQLFEQFRELILSGRLKPGSRLPATRDLSGQLRVSRNTVLLTYDQLIAEGYLESRAAVGTFVSECLPEDTLFSTQSGLNGTEPNQAQRLPVKCAPVFSGRAQLGASPHADRLDHDFWIGKTDADLFPRKVWRRLLVRSFDRFGDRLSEYGDACGLFELRQAIADRLGPSRGINVEPDQILITGGSQEGLNVVSRLLVGPGDKVAIENPCYQGAAFVFESYGAKLVPINVDRNGLRFSELKDKDVGLVYATPSHQHPIGETLSLDRRMRLLDWGCRNGTYILEDDYDSDFRYNAAPLTALKGLDRNGCTIYLGTFSKSVGVGLRIGYLVLPRELVAPARTIKTLLDSGNPRLEQAALAEFINSGGYDNHLRRIRQAYQSRRDALISALQQHFGDVDLRGTDGGMHLSWHLPDGFPPALRVEELARARGVGAYAIANCGAHIVTPTPYDDTTLMFGYSPLNEHKIAAGVAILADALKEHAGRCATISVSKRGTNGSS